MQVKTSKITTQSPFYVLDERLHKRIANNVDPCSYCLNGKKLFTEVNAKEKEDLWVES